MERKKTADQTPNNDKKQALDTAIRQIEKNLILRALSDELINRQRQKGVFGLFAVLVYSI